MVFERALKKGEKLKRLTRDEALAIATLHSREEFTDRNFPAMDTVALGKAAFNNRIQRYGRKASWVYNLHINSSNICSGGCAFCAFAAASDDEKKATF